MTELVFVLDRGGAMAGLEGDTIGGLNAKKKVPDEAFASTVLFENVSEVIYNRVDIQKLQPMTDRDCYVRSCTGLKTVDT